MRRRRFLQMGAMAAAAPFLPNAFAAPAAGLGPKRMRGLMIDAARLPEKLAYYRRVIDFCRDSSINTILFRLTDDQGSAMKFDRLPELVTHPHAFSVTEANELAAYADRFGITLIPEIETFGHTSYITSVDEYKHLADTDASERGGFVGICPVSPDTRRIVATMIREVAGIFSSPYIHCGCDEVNWGGSEMSKQALAKQSRAEIWADYINFLDTTCQTVNRQMIVWGDHIAHKEPTILEKISKRVVVMDWQYYVTTPKPLAETARKITSAGLRAIGAPALVTCEWGPRPGAESLTNVDSYVEAYSNTDPKCLGVIVTNWVPSRYLANSLWDCFGYAATSMHEGAAVSRRMGLQKFAEKFYGIKWDAEWRGAFADLYRLTPGRTCTREWKPPRLPLAAASDDDVKQAASVAKPLDPAPYAQLADNIRALGRGVQKNKVEFAVFSLAVDYIADIVWREAQWTKFRGATPEQAAALATEIAHRDADLLKRVEAEWSMSRYDDDRWKQEKLPHLTPYDQLVMRLRQAAAYSAEIAKDPQRIVRLLAPAPAQ